MNSQGSAMAENEKYLDSIQGKTDILTNSMQTLWNNALNSDFLKFLLDIANGLVQAADNVGLLNTAFGAFIGFKALTAKENTLFDFLKIFKGDDSGFGLNKNSAIGNIFAGVKANGIKGLSGAFSGLASSINLSGVAATFLNTALSAITSIGIGFAITGIIQVFKQLATIEERAAERANEVVEAYTEAKNTLKSQKTTIDEVSDSYVKLSKGVDLDTNKNISLTTDSYEKYLNVCNQIADMYPELVSGYDSQGNAILSLKGNVDQLTQAYNNAAQAARQQMIAGGKDVFGSFKANYKDRSGIFDSSIGYSNQIDLAQEFLDAASSNDQQVMQDLYNKYKSANGIGLFRDVANMLSSAGINSSDLVSFVFGKGYVVDTSAWEKSKTKLLSFIRSTNTKINTETSKVKSLMDAYLGEDLHYATLSDKSRSFVDQIVSGLDAEFINSFDTADDLYNYIKTNIVNVFKDPSVSSAIGDLSDLQLEFADGGISYGDYQKQLTELLGKIQNKFDADTLNKIKIAIGIDETSLVTDSNHIKTLLNNTVTDVESKINSLSVEDLQIAGQLEVPEGTLYTWDELTEKIKEAKIAATQDFDIADHTQAISAHSAMITEYQEALQKLDKGSFTMNDFMELVEKYPDLAKGVDISSKAFYGLSRNLNKAIKTSTKSFIKDLKNLRASLEEAGKSTESIDQLIDAIENMPEDALDSIIEKYGTMADEIERAKLAQDRLTDSMGENPNEGYETRGEAMDYIKEALSRGEIGSESNVWNVAKQYGFTYDSAKTINENADALANYVAVREKWFKKADDGDNRTKDGYSYEGTENFIKDVEKVVEVSEAAGTRLSEILDWDYNEKTGEFKFDFDNENLPEIISLLGQAKELIGLTEEEWHDMMIQIGQYFDINWEDAKDVSDYISKIAEGSGDAATKIETMTDAVERYVEKELGIDLDSSSLTEASVEALECDDSIKELLKTYLDLKESMEDPLNIESKLDESGSVASLVGMDELKGSITQGEFGHTFINTDTFTTVLQEAGYTEDKITSLIAKIQEYQGVIAVTNDDPLGLNSQNKSVESIISSLNTLGVKYETVKGDLGQPIGINITTTDLITTLQGKGWTTDQIKSYLQTLTSTENGLGIQVDGKVNMTTEEIDAAIEKSKEIPEQETTSYEVTGTGASTIQTINNGWSQVPAYVSTTYAVNIQTNGTLPDLPTSSALGAGVVKNANGNFHISGGAFASGTVGAPKTETSLVGELGPELIVDPSTGRWHTVGEQGAEFTQVKKGDIIFNHKQTEQLLKNGYVTSRGRLQGDNSAFASGTAFASGGGTFNRYEFDGNGGWTKYDVNNMKGAASSLSNAADKVSDAADEFEEVFDWIEVRLEEINEHLSLKSAQLENAIGYSNKNPIINEMININKTLRDNLIAGANEYYDYSKSLLAKVPDKYKEAAQDGTIAIEEFVGEVDEKTLEAIQDYREWVQKGADATQQAEEVLTEIQSLAKQAFDNIVDEFENKLSLNDSKIDRFDSHNSLLETDKGFESENIYQAMIDENESKLKLLEQQAAAMQAELDSGKIEKYSDAWYEAVNAIAEVDTEIVNLQTEVEDLQDSINELHWEKFEVLMKQFEAINDEAEDLLDILGQEDAVDEFGKWTDKGITSLGLLAQRMEVAEMKAQQYKEEIEYLNENWEKLGYTQEEYIDKLDELKSGQYDSIKAYHDAKDAIVDLNKERVDAIKDGIEKEIDAYEELIDKKKEALDADKDAHDWQKSVAKQQKNISDIERQIAALSADNSISARAKRAQLEAELLEAKAEMDEMYYDRTVEKQKEALDKELESFQETKENEIEDWEKYLENVELVVSDTIAMVQESTQTVLETLTILGQEFGLTITEALTNPWKAGENAIQNYGEKLNMSLTELAALFGMTVDEFAAKLDLTTEGLVSKLDITVAEMATSLGLTQEQLAAKLGLTTADLSGKMNMTIQQFATSIGYTIPQLANKLGTTTSGLVGNLNMTMTQFAGRLGLTVDQLAGKFGLTTKDLASKLGQTYQQLTNPFGMSMSSTVDALKSLEKEYQKILNDIESQSLATVSRVNHAMEKYTNKANNNTSTSTKQKTVTLGSKINAGSAKIYSDSYGGGVGTQYYGNDPIYTVIGENNGYWLVRYHKLSSGYTGWFKKSDVKAYAKGTTGVPKDQWALIDELGDELQLIPDGNGRLSYMKKGTGVVPADLTSNLMEWGKLDPSVMLDQNRPQICASPSVVNNTTEISIDASVGELIHVEHLDGNNPAEITKIVDKAWDKRMKELNSFVRKYSR